MNEFPVVYNLMIIYGVMQHVPLLRQAALVVGRRYSIDLTTMVSGFVADHLEKTRGGHG